MLQPLHPVHNAGPQRVICVVQICMHTCVTGLQHLVDHASRIKTKDLSTAEVKL